MIRQLLLIAGVACFLLLLGVALINLKPADKVTVHFAQGIEPQEIKGTVKKQEKYLIVKPENSNDELIFTWDKVKDISGEENYVSKRFSDVYDVTEFLTKLGALAAAGVFFIGLYQYEQGQQWISHGGTTPALSSGHAVRRGGLLQCGVRCLRVALVRTAVAIR